MKKLLTALILLFLVLLMSINVCAESYNDDFRNSVTMNDSLLSESTDLNDPNSIKSDLTFEHIFTYLWSQICASFQEALQGLFFGISLIFLSVLLSHGSDQLSNQNIKRIFGLISSVAMVLMIEINLSGCAEALQKSIQNMSVFTAACIPSFSVVMIAAGEGGAAAVFSGALVFLGEAGSLISKSFLLPLMDVYLSIGVCSAVSDEYNFSVLAKQLKRFIIWFIGAVLLVLRLIMRLQTTTASAGDMLVKKYIRAAVGGMIPMVGNTLSQGVDGLFAIASGVKTSFSIAGVLIVLSIMLPTLVHIGAYGFSWSICKWIAGFMNEKTVNRISSVLADGFYLMLALGGAVTMMGLFSFFGIMTQV